MFAGQAVSFSYQEHQLITKKWTYSQDVNKKVKQFKMQVKEAMQEGEQRLLSCLDALETSLVSRLSLPGTLHELVKEKKAVDKALSELAVKISAQLSFPRASVNLLKHLKEHFNVNEVKPQKKESLVKGFMLGQTRKDVKSHQTEKAANGVELQEVQGFKKTRF
jgi:hypothetical protein